MFFATIVLLWNQTQQAKIIQEQSLQILDKDGEIPLCQV